LPGNGSRIFNDLQLVGTIFAALLGLAFGSFLNVFVSRFPEGESVVTPRSHCRNCEHTLAWWENVPLLSWILLRGRCRSCRMWIGWRYPLVELAVGALWTGCWLRFCTPLFSGDDVPNAWGHALVQTIGFALLAWMLVALAALDAEHLWLPDWLTWPGIGLGFLFTLYGAQFGHSEFTTGEIISPVAWNSLVAILGAAALVLFIRLVHWLVRRREGMGLGDAKLMAMLGAWLGLIGALESFTLAVILSLLAALIWLAIHGLRGGPGVSGKWAQIPLPFGTFLCMAAFSEIFYPSWLWTWYSRAFLF
jgi:leader peptidase (prepilin peptidase) / N-methyltransferase